MRRFYLLIIVAIITLTICLFSTPLFFDKVPDDYSRLTTINQWSSNPDIKPNVVIFGSSSAMNAIDGNLMAERLKCKVASYTNTGMSFTESSLFYSRLPESVKIVIQVLYVYGGKWETGIALSKIDRLMIGGYQLDSLSSLFADSEARDNFERSNIEVYYHARNYLKNGIHYKIRSILEPNEACDSADISIAYPYLFQYERADDATWNKYVMMAQQVKTDTMEVSSEFTESIKIAQDYFRSRNIHYYIVLTPISSSYEIGIPNHYTKSIKQFQKKTGVDVIDYTFLLEDSFFADPDHLNRAGGAVLTNNLCDYLKKDLDLD